MTSDEVIQLRAKLNLTQMQLALLLGTHVMCVSKWERGVAAPSEYHRSMLRCFHDGVARRPAVAAETLATLHSGKQGAILRATYQLLRAAFESEAA